MNFQHLKHFVAVAEELHFGRAAERIGMAQPPLSQSIRRLEDAFGCLLFSRARRRVELTPAGVALLTHARKILDQLEYAQKAVLRAAEGRVGRIGIGFTSNALSKSVPAAMRELRRLEPLVEISLWEGTAAAQIAKLLTGDLDLAFFHTDILEIQDLEMRLAEKVSTVAAIPEDWPLAKKRALKLVDLADQPLLFFPASNSPAFHAAVMAVLRSTGRTPQIAQEATFDDTRLKLVAAGMGVSLINSTTAPRGYPGVKLAKIDGLPFRPNQGIMMAWRRKAPATLRRLLESAYEAIQRDRPAPAMG